MDSPISPPIHASAGRRPRLRASSESHLSKLPHPVRDVAGRWRPVQHAQGRKITELERRLGDLESVSAATEEDLLDTLAGTDIDS